MYVSVHADEFCGDVNQSAVVRRSELVEAPNKQVVCVFRRVGYDLRCVAVAGALVEFELGGHCGFDVFVRIDVLFNAAVCAVCIADEGFERTLVCNAHNASVKHSDGESDALRTYFVGAVVVLATVVDDCVCGVFSARISDVDAAEVPRYRQLNRCAVCKRNVEFCREVDVISVEFRRRHCDVFAVHKLVRAVKVVLDVSADCRARFLVAISAISALSCKHVCI